MPGAAGMSCPGRVTFRHAMAPRPAVTFPTLTLVLGVPLTGSGRVPAGDSDTACPEIIRTSRAISARATRRRRFRAFRGWWHGARSVRTITVLTMPAAAAPQ